MNFFADSGFQTGACNRNDWVIPNSFRQSSLMGSIMKNTDR